MHPYQIKTSREIVIGDFSYSSQWPRHWQCSLEKKCAVCWSQLGILPEMPDLEAHRLLTTTKLANAHFGKMLSELRSGSAQPSPRPIFAFRLVFNCFF